MITDAILAFFHFIAIFALVWFLAKEWTLLRAGIPKVDVERLALTDMGVGISAVVVLLAGAGRAVFGIQPWAFYAANPVFHAKVGLFILVALLSIIPTRQFLGWRRQRRADASWSIPEAEWKRARRMIMIEVHLIGVIVLLAVLMARGIGIG